VNGFAASCVIVGDDGAIRGGEDGRREAEDCGQEEEYVEIEDSGSWLGMISWSTLKVASSHTEGMSATRK
jgi:hypothetical protein